MLCSSFISLRSIPANQDCWLWFSTRNDAPLNTAGNDLVLTIPADPQFSQQTLAVAPGSSRLNVVQYFTAATATASSSLPGASSLISLTLRAALALTPNSRILVTGLTGSSTPSNASLPLLPSGGAFAATGNWSQSRGTLEVRLLSPLFAAFGTLSFRLGNPAGSGAGVTPSVGTVDKPGTARITSQLVQADPAALHLWAPLQGLCVVCFFAHARGACR